jgi:restriction endonuclease S subunit
VVDQFDLLRVTLFSNLERWSVDSAISQQLHSSYQTKKLSSVIKRVKDVVIIKDNESYRRITVKLNGNGVIERDRLLGVNIGTKRQFQAKAGQLILSRIDARNGAFGIVPQELDGAIVTNDFWLFDVQEAYPKFVMLILSAHQFKDYWQNKSNGTTNRQRVGESDFLNSIIPYPNLNEQIALVSKFEDMMSEAEVCEREIAKLEEQIETYLFGCLGIKKQQKKEEHGFIKPYFLSQLSRWDVWTRNDEYFSNKYKYSYFESIVVGSPLYGANEKAIKKRSDIRYIRITDVNEDGSLNDDFVSASKVEEKYLLKENDFLIARTGNTVGKTFLYKNEHGKCIFAGYLVKYILNSKKVIPEYVLYYTKSELYKSWIKNNQRIFGQPNINGKEYLKSLIIIPPLEVQTDIVDYITQKKDQIKGLRQKADKLRQLAKYEFGKTVFGERE